MNTAADKTRGRWQSIMPHFGVESRYLTGKHTPCPMCGGRDRFRFDDKEGRGTFICTKCGAGDGFRLVELMTRREFKEIVREVERVAGVADYTAPVTGPDQAETLQRMRDLWKTGGPCSASDWWLERDINAPKTPDIRWSSEAGAMLSLVRDPDGRVVNMHRTYLPKKNRLLMPLPLPAGCAVRVCEYTPGGSIGVAEGIETAQAAFDLFQVPTWACMTADNLSKWIPPEDAGRIIIFADNDASFTGMWAAGTLAKRLAAQKRNVIVKFPDKIGDWNDVLMRGDTCDSE